MKILISGAGIAGLSAASYLIKEGHTIKIIEVADNLRAEGYMMDFFNPGYELAEKTGLIKSLKSKEHKVRRFYFVNKNGKTRSSFSYEKITKLVDNKYLLILRGSLVEVLYEHVKGKISIEYTKSLKKLIQGNNEVLVTYNDGSEEHFDMVVGADGIHSKVRELVFGPEELYRKYMGFYVASYIFNKKVSLPKGYDNFYSISEPHKQFIIYPINKDKFVCFFAWRTDEYTNSLKEEKHLIIKETFNGMGWIVPDIVNTIQLNEDFYFDTASQIKMTDWHKGRVVLIGDACACLSLLAGQGSSFAMAGAYLLADSLKKPENNLEKAYGMYSGKLQPVIKIKQEDAEKFANTFVPDSRLTILLRDFFIKIMFLPGIKRMTKKQLGGENNDLF